MTSTVKQEGCKGGMVIQKTANLTCHQQKCTAQSVSQVVGLLSHTHPPQVFEVLHPKWKAVLLPWPTRVQCSATKTLKPPLRGSQDHHGMPLKKCRGSKQGSGIMRLKTCVAGDKSPLQILRQLQFVFYHGVPVRKGCSNKGTGVQQGFHQCQPDWDSGGDPSK